MLQSAERISWILIVCTSIFPTSTLFAQANHPAPTLEQKVQKAIDIQEVANLMARKEYYHSAQHNLQELDELWVQGVPDAVFAQNQGYYVGMDTIKKYYGLMNQQVQALQLKEARKAYPEIPDSPASWGVGMYIIHSLTTPIIEIAGDGKTAKAAWYSPGLIIGPPEAGKPQTATWLWERYGVDFLKQNDVWKVWHAHVYTDIAAPQAEDMAQAMIAAGKKEAAPVGSEGSTGAQVQKLMAGAQAAFTQGPGYKQWSPKTVPVIAPRLPVPYYTFSETFSYGKE